ncbi:MAG: PLP-dependent aminotransferase [Firmicutes bacterium]|nr:PLP-dependent aminotransferase [Bacillota bacterium]MDI6705328.1 aspartate aminotransferase family protein [Bacillota bacterium]
MDRLVTLDQALELNRKQVRDKYKKYVNPGLVTMMGLLDFDKRFVKASGCEVWDQDGNIYLDFLGGYGALNMGHNPEPVIDALNRVMGSPNILQASLNPFASVLAENLEKITPGDLKYSFFCNSGTEAVEAALKMARASTGKSTILYCDNSFHGKSFGSLSVTGREKYRKPFQPTLPGCIKVEYDSLSSLEQHMSAGDVAAVIVEPVQGEGGIIVPKQGYLEGVRALCSRYGALLIADEIQTGLGRTGKIFACEHERVVPDIMCIAKSLGGGMVPVGACIATEEVYSKAYGNMEKCLLHTSTFGGNSLAMAAGIAAIEFLIKNNLSEKAAELGSYALERLLELKSRYSIIKDVRGKGLMIGIEFASGEGGVLDVLSGGTASKLGREYIGAMVAGELLNRHRIITAYTLNNPNVIRFEPPLIITREQVDYMIHSLESILEKNNSVYKMAISGIKSSVASKLRGIKA